VQKLLHEAFEAKAQPDIVRTLANAADLHAAFGAAKYTMETMDVQPLQVIRTESSVRLTHGYLSRF
jgi:hypothetical protein